ncbi:MAG: pilin [Patescibacteria group bacterium]|nr:pilin [Patescibacteria group bacterium]
MNYFFSWLKKIFFICFVFVFLFIPAFAQTNNDQMLIENETQQTNINELKERYAACDFCGYCPPNPPPESWLKCKKCLYPDLSDDPSLLETLKINPETNLPPTPALGKQYTFLGCLGGDVGFAEEGSAKNIIQSILNIIFSIIGGVAFIYLIYGSFIITTSFSDREKLNYGKRIITGAIIGLVFSLGSVFIVNLIASSILKLPIFSK